MARQRGRRPSADPEGGGAAQATIRAVAKQQFATLGYPGTTIRGIAREADVDPKLVTHYFGSKHQLFVAVFEPPFDPASVFPLLLADGPEGVGRRFAQFAVGVMDGPASNQTVTGLIRAATSEEAAAGMMREVLIERLLGPLIEQLGGDQADLRASLTGSLMAGLVLARHIIGLPPLAQVPAPVLVDAIAPVIQHYLTGDLTGETAGDGSPTASSRSLRS